MAQQRRSYAWALLTDAADVPLAALSPRARRGLALAQALAKDARGRSAAKHDWKRHPRLTIAELARQQGLSESSTHRLLAQARHELFGEISDSAIYKRLHRDPDREQRQPRPCREDGS